MGKGSSLGFSLGMAIVLGLGTVALIALPLIHGRVRGRRDQERRAALQEKRAALQLLAELEHDLQTGKLEEEDYSQQKAEVEGRAVAAMKRLDALGGAAGQDEVEGLIRVERAKLQRGRQR